MNQFINNYIDDQSIEYEKAHLAEKYFDYKMLVREYREGILLFELMDQEVWNRAIIDTTGLKQYFDRNSENYKWGARIDAIIFRSEKIEDINLARKYLAKLFYPVFEDTLYVSVTENEKIINFFEDEMDSLYQIVIHDSTYFLEVSSNYDVWDQLYNFIKSNGLLLEKFVYREVEGDTSGFNIVSSSKINRKNKNLKRKLMEIQL